MANPGTYHETWKTDRRAMFPVDVIRYIEIKEKFPKSIVLLKVGDFYEAMFEDALIISKVLEIVLTRKSAGLLLGTLPLAGIPYHALPRYRGYLLDAGYSVHIDQFS